MKTKHKLMLALAGLLLVLLLIVIAGNVDAQLQHYAYLPIVHNPVVIYDCACVPLETCCVPIEAIP